ncbi:MAG: phosphatase PAP2 family protein [Solirubrobacterales bacterium]|nr:phosphatase PAP2 family protein [Solirubrobacterales bacterium]
MFQRPRQLRPAPPPERSRRLARWAAAGSRPFGRTLQAIGRTDQRILLALRTQGHSDGLDRVVGALGSFGEMGIGWAGVGIAGAIARPEQRERWIAAAAVAPIAILVNYSVKLTIGRQRPLIDDHPPLARAPSKLSFPSAHSTSAVAAATALGRVSPRSRPAYYVLAGAICAGRPYLGMHYPSDVLAGAGLGYLIGRIFPLPAGPEVVERTAAGSDPVGPAIEVVVTS